MTPTEAVFCDANAGLPAAPDVLARFVEVEARCPGNPASAHAAGRRARAELDGARDRLAAALGVASADVIFTSGGTEAANLAVHGLGDLALPALLAPTEHAAVHEPAAVRGIEPWRVDGDGRALVVEPARPVGLVCLVHAQSELGTVQPVDAALALARQLGVPCFVDAAQSLGRLPRGELLAAGAIVALSPHKAGGLRGHGVLAGADLAARLQPLLRGGAQELGRRPGTHSPALAAANALAIEQAVAERSARAAAMAAGRSAFLAGLAASGATHRLVTPPDSLPNTALVHFPDVDGRNLVPALDLAGVQASHGAACSSGAPTPPRILTAIGLAEAEARACVRFSFGWREDLERLRRTGGRTGDVVRALQKKSAGA
ncbi:MAG: aminotransferase class V-fold PLP-dependent enzyme [Planctomycetota bacterium]